MYSSTFGKGWVGRSCLYLLVRVSFGSFSLRELTCMHCVYLALWTRKVLCGSFLCTIYKFSFIHLLLLFIAFIQRYSLLSSRLTALMLETILNERLYHFIAWIFDIHGSSVLDSALWLLHGWCHVKLLLSRRRLCVHHSTIHQFTVSVAIHSKSHNMQGACMFSCNLPPALLAEWPGSFMCYCSGTDTEIRVSTESWPWRRQFPTTPVGTWTRGPFDQEPDALTAELPPLPSVRVHHTLYQALLFVCN